MATEVSASRSWTLASFPVSAGKEVMRNEPWVYSLHPKNFHHLCYRCFTPLDPSQSVRPDLFAKNFPAPRSVNALPCPDCNVVKYCSQECQTADKTTWRHGMECSLLKKLNATGTTPHHDMLIILKIMARLLNDDGSSTRASSKPWIYSGRDYNRQLSHAEEILQNDVWMKDAQHLRQLLESVMDEADIPDLRSLVEMYGKLKVNSFDIRDQYLRRLGEGFYFEAAKFDHSCLRNALFFFDGLTLVIRAIEDIPDALKVRVSYIELFTTISIRQKNLEWFFFRCNCPMCHDPQKIADMECIRCCTPACQQAVPLDMDTRNRDPCPDCMQFIQTQLAQDPNSKWKDFKWHDDIAHRLSAAYKLLEEHSKQHDEIFRMLDDASATRPGGDGHGQGASHGQDVLAEGERRCERMLEEGRDLLHPANWTRCVTHTVLARVLLATGDVGRRMAAGEHFALALPGIRRGLRPNDTRAGVQTLMAALLPLSTPQFVKALGEQGAEVDRNVLANISHYAAEAKRIFSISDGTDRGLYRISDSLEGLCSKLTGKSTAKTVTDAGPWLESMVATMSDLVCRSLFPVVY